MFTRPEREIDRVFLHCSASDNPDHDSIDVVREWHVKDRGWNDVGYHYFIRRDGTLEIGRSLERTPAAQRGNNTGALAICLHGLASSRFSKAQYRTLIELATRIEEAYGGMVSFHGHCEVSSKSCPVFPYRAVLGLDNHGAMVFQPTDSPSFADAADFSSDADGEEVDGQASFPMLNLTSHGTMVTRLQNLLSREGFLLEEDGLFGQATRDAVKEFQRQHQLRVDGIVGPRTWSALTREQ